LASYYVRSGATGTGTGATWANAKTTLAAGLAVAAAGDDVYVSEDHAESATGTRALTSSGTAANPCRILCVNHAGSVPPVSADLRTTGQVQATTTSPTVSFTGYAYCYGLTFIAGSAAASAGIFNILNTAAGGWWKFDNCTFTTLATGSSIPTFGMTGTGNAADQLIEFENTFFNWPVGSQATLGHATVTWRKGGGFAGTAPTTPFIGALSKPGRLFLDGVDLSALGAGKYLMDVSQGSGRLDVVNCKLNAALGGLTTGSIGGPGGWEMRLIDCDSAGTNYRYARQNYQGTITQDTATYRTGGATDGTTPVSRKMVTGTASKFYNPLVSDNILFWNESLSAITVTIPLVSSLALSNADMWMEVEYPGDAGSPLSSFDLSTRASDTLAAGTSLPVDGSSTWVGAPASPVKNYLSATFTPALKGPIAVRVALAKPSATVWFDPQAIVTSGRTWMTFVGSQVNEGPATGGGGGGNVIVVEDD
jgi:hypothetical protein